MTTRELKALEIAARMRLTYDNGIWTVPSSSGNGTYRVSSLVQAGRCHLHLRRLNPSPPRLRAHYRRPPRA